MHLDSDSSYYYFGVEKTIVTLFMQYAVLSQCQPEEIKLAVNIDGLPLSKSTNSNFWPVLCMIKGIKIMKNKVFPVAIFHGPGKPSHPDVLLKDVGKECSELSTNGISIGNYKMAFKIEMLLCDVAAKSFVLQIKGHSGYFSCSKCMVEGDVIDGYVCYVDRNFNLRTDDSFRQRSQIEHHIGSSVLENLPNFNMIENVPLDYMHLICLGVVKRLLVHKNYGWIFGKPPYKLRASLVNKVSQRLLVLQRHMASDFSRKTRSISECKRYKATELRTF